MATVITIKEDLKLNKTNFINIWEFFGYSMMNKLPFYNLTEQTLEKPVKDNEYVVVKDKSWVKLFNKALGGNKKEIILG